MHGMGCDAHGQARSACAAGEARVEVCTDASGGPVPSDCRDRWPQHMSDALLAQLSDSQAVPLAQLAFPVELVAGGPSEPPEVRLTRHDASSHSSSCSYEVVSSCRTVELHVARQADATTSYVASLRGVPASAQRGSGPVTGQAFAVAIDVSHALSVVASQAILLARERLEHLRVHVPCRRPLTRAGGRCGSCLPVHDQQGAAGCSAFVTYLQMGHGKEAGTNLLCQR
jgi:hypothetical protein